MPSMFHLHVHTKKELDNLNKLDDTELCTFFHEYIHFLQDISTVMGLHNIYTLGEVLADLVTQIEGKAKGEIHIPYHLSEKFNVGNNYMIVTATQGDGDIYSTNILNTLTVTGKSVERSQLVRMDGNDIDVHIVEVPNSTGTDFKLGSYHISESMAYMGEQIIYGQPGNIVGYSPNYPYDVIRQLACQYDQRLGGNLKLLFALCDFALTFSHPAHALISFFDDYVKRGCPPQWRDYVKWLVYNTATTGTVTGSYSQGLTAIKDLALKSLDNRFKGWNNVDVRKWYHTIIERVLKMRLDNPLFLIDLLEGGNLKKNPIFHNIIKNLGTPLLSNDFCRTNVFIPEDVGIKKKRIKLLMAAGSITFLLGDADIPCMLRKYCQADGRCVDKKSVRSPWVKARKFFPCPFGYLWYGWKLRGYIPTTH